MNDQQLLLLERFVHAAEGLELTMKNIEGILGRFLARPDSLEMLQEAKNIVQSIVNNSRILSSSPIKSK